MNFPPELPSDSNVETFVDPTGSEVSTFDPAIIPPPIPPVNPPILDLHYYGDGDKDWPGGCVVDGQPADCDRASKLLRSGAAQLLGHGAYQHNIIPTGRGTFIINVLPDTGEGHHVDDYFAGFIQAQGGQQGGELQPPSSCEIFTDLLILDAQDRFIGQTNIGRKMGHWAVYNLAPRARAIQLESDGFQQKYIAGGQNGFALVHIAGVAGATLIGHNRVDPIGDDPETGYQRAQRQFDEDTQQLNFGINAQALGLTTTGQAGLPGYDPNHLLQDFIDEKHAEREDDGAGTIVGHTLASAIDGKTPFLGARQQIFDLLCTGRSTRPLLSHLDRRRRRTQP